ncbi:unnamed protein product [Triticum turgidum subsp. durum]|uniref:F-box domain-containing protein n=1 Tax=Triticum turgidum subsp. durum TaxID=4567 RepID=A0A9R1BHF7_TRITD|nr:unnamed protein product [Triticum turgidum subsp. durum]
MAPPPTSNPVPPPEPPSLRVQDGLLQEIFLPSTVMASPPVTGPQQIPQPASSVADLPDVLLEEIFLRLPAAADLARASTACASFHSVISGHAFLRRYRVIHPPPLIGMVHDPFIPAQQPHPSAVPARAFAGFNFSCSSFLPSTAGRSWSEIDFFDGRALLAGAPVKEESGSRFLVGAELCDSQYSQFLVRVLAVCDPVHRCYILLPAVPDHLKALVRRPDLLMLETFLAPGEDEDDPLSFRVVCLAQCRINLLMLGFSSLDGQWHILIHDQWSAQATIGSFENSEPWLSCCQYVHRCFCWRLHFMNKLLLLDTHTMEFSVVSLPPEQPPNRNYVIVEAADGMLGMLTKRYDEYREDDRCWLAYSILRNNQWYSEKVILLPVKHAALVGVAGGYLLVEALYTPSTQHMLKFGLFSVDVKTLQVELFAELSKPNMYGRLYAGLPPSLCAPTI